MVFIKNLDSFECLLYTTLLNRKKKHEYRACTVYDYWLYDDYRLPSVNLVVVSHIGCLIILSIIIFMFTTSFYI